MSMLMLISSIKGTSSFKVTLDRDWGIKSKQNTNGENTRGEKKKSSRKPNPRVHVALTKIGNPESQGAAVLKNASFCSSCSFGVTRRTRLGDIAPGETGAGEETLLFVEVIGPAPLPPEAAATPATPSMPRTFSTALLSPFVHGSRLTRPAPAERLEESRRLDSACRAWRLESRRGPGPQSCEQPAVAHPPSLIEMSPSQVVIQAR